MTAHIGSVCFGLKLTYEAFPHTRQQLENLRVLAVTQGEHERVAAIALKFDAEDQAASIARNMYRRVMAAKYPEKEEISSGTGKRNV